METPGSLLNSFDDKATDSVPVSEALASDKEKDSIKDNEMAEWFPFKIQSELPELQNEVRNGILACKDLTWMEFLKLLIIEPNSDYVIKGTAGRELNFDSKVEDYVRTFKRKLKAYPVTIAKLSQSTEQNEDAATQKPKARPKRRRSPKHKKESKRPKVEKPSINNHINKQPSDQQVQCDESQPKNINDIATAMGAQVRSVQPPSQSSVSSEMVNNINSKYPNKSPRPKIITAVNAVHPTQNSDSPFTKQSSTKVATSQINGPLNSGFLQPNPLCNENNIRQSEGQSFTNKQGFSVNHQYYPPEKNGLEGLDVDSSEDESIIARNPRRYSNVSARPNLKPALLKFLVNKVSNRDMLKVREELMKLKESDDYFKLTALSPLAAGLLDQMLIRNPSQT